MKKIIYCTMVAALITTIFTGCKKDKTLKNSNVTPVTNLFFPADNEQVKILNAEGSVNFEWQQAKSEDNGFVQYEVAFDKEDGDFSKPLYVLPSDQNGLLNKLTISYGTLNTIAELAGIEPLGKGKLKWTVMSSKGINVKQATISRVVEMERPSGLRAPAVLYITGTATEGGDDLDQAQSFRKNPDGKFEIYTKLKPGTYHFVDGNSGTPATYSVAGTVLQPDGETTVESEKVYRIVLNFQTQTAEITEIVSVGFWFSPNGEVQFELPYVGKGVWQATNEPIVFKQESWGRDERYKFRFTVKKAGGEEEFEFYGSRNGDNGRPDPSTPPIYFDVVLVTPAQYDNSFKFNGDADNKNVDIRLDFGVSTYTHSVTIK
ncbi:hypothetical protein DJ568_08935 [Mucilaginibacter hurinus]|uniref:SusE outer membrane protein domain-containing protein n=1 Tax=Mucilaginibacter hurinus TaxID=2201324 RepID=A0A367GP92_9SPHI|nr:SusE domain-containing protein [Mucilaginibacter hurinus]RCH55297.1 hypothetical protein DJ568_08935 [Mucilaginibacter hurinus]